MQVLMIAAISLVAAAVVLGTIAPFLHENASRLTLYLGAASAVFIILIAARQKPPDLGLLIVGIIAGLLLVASFVISPKRRDRVFAVGTDLGHPRLPRGGLEDKGPLPKASILDPIFQKHAIADAPPTGYWSIILPTSMVLGRSYSVTLNLPAVGSFSGETDIDKWLRLVGLDRTGQNAQPVTVRPWTQSFAVEPSERRLQLRPERRLKATFLVSPTKAGRHALRFELNIGDEMLGWSEEIIRIRRNTQVFLTAATMLLGLVGAIVAILTGLKVI